MKRIHCNALQCSCSALNRFPLSSVCLLVVMLFSIHGHVDVKTGEALIRLKLAEAGLSTQKSRCPKLISEKNRRGHRRP